MADPYRRNPHDSEDMSSFLVNLLHGSSSASDLDFRERAMADFSDPSRFYAADFKEGVEEDVFSKVDDFDFGLEESDALEMPTNEVQPCSSKRSRSTEFHNLSEKRRRSKINEKLKALQNLIPNSNKTDKASMLDEAIEYLKQLQLRVQMLTTRNGLNVYPTYVPGSLHSMQLPTGIEFDGGSVMLSANRGAALLENSDMMQTSFEYSNHNPWCKQTIRRTQ